MPESTEDVPRYAQIAHYYRDLIMSGSFRPGDELPSERRLADEWTVARPTAARALLTLRLDGLTESRQGAGTYVADVRPHLAADEHHRRPRSGEGPDGPGEQTRIVAAELTEAPEAVAQVLTLDHRTQAVRRSRVVLAGDHIVEISISWYPPGFAGTAPRLLRQARIREGTADYIEQTTGRRPEYARDHARARMATPGERDELGIGHPDVAVLVVRHVVYDDSDEAIEFAESVQPPDTPGAEREYRLT